MDKRHPRSVEEISKWSRDYNLPVGAGRRRFAQYKILEAISLSDFSKIIHFKGGNALRLIHMNPRGTIDLDFSAGEEVQDNGEWIRSQVSIAVGSIQGKDGIKTKVQRVRRNPIRSDATFPTYQVTIGYAIAGDRSFRSLRLFESKPLADVVQLEISINETVCATANETFADNLTLSACTLEDIIAEKLRSLLQQRTRNRNRKQDVFDIARLQLHCPESIDKYLVASYLVSKCEAKKVDLAKSLYDEEIMNRAKTDYDLLKADLREQFIDFPAAWDQVIKLVESLDIPE